ncbi:MAG: ATP-dependent Clp protease proteolytic subunit [Verrucomicrobia bacterium]|nr:ATP-dependent Clp protease proteolytic subunit [Verrucomicrobiota bacterium]
MTFVPYILEETPKGERSMDIYSRLLQDRIILLGTEVSDVVANNVIAQLIFLRANEPNKPISLYINSPGGSISAGLAIYDTIQYLECEVNTYCIGLAASMGALLLAAGTKGRRYALPNSRIMIHQPHAGITGTAQDIQIQAKEILYLKKITADILSKHTGQNLAKILEDTERDFFLSADEAVEYGLIDNVIRSKKEKK